ncbi:hypothetical protein DRN87_04475 [Candidatus Geothermarchaeota archaeon]|nr:MAG: hypothetical protein DRN87_04475 [Candidatus Geothermarchaeota archaeon]
MTYEPFGVLFLPGRTLYGFRVIADNKPGVLERISKVFAKNGINIQKLIATQLDEVADLIFFCDFTGLEKSLNTIYKHLKDLNVVKNVSVIDPLIDGLIVDYTHFPNLLLNEIVILFPETLFREFIKGMRDEYGTAAETFLYYTGLKIGKELWIKLDKLSEKAADKIKIFRYLFSLYGLGKLEYIDNQEVKVVKLYDSIECKHGVGSNKSYSHFIRGILAGIFENIYGKIEIVETKCISKGDKYCEFKLLFK